MDAARIKESEAAASEALAGDPESALVIAMGKAYHQAGVASDQLEDLMDATARAVGLEMQVTALPTSITAALGPGHAQKVVLLRLQPGEIDLRRLALLDVVFEGVVHHTIATPLALAEIERIGALRHAARPMVALVAYCALSFGASILLGGHQHEQIAAAIVGLAVGVVSILARQSPTIARLFEVLAAFAATGIVSLYATFVHPLNVYVPIVAGVVQLLPGLQLTLALHELAYRNLVAGTARLGGVLMSLLSLGCGFALGVAVLGPAQFHVNGVFATAIPWYLLAVGVGGIAGAIAVLENARPVDVPLVLGSCGVAEIAYRLFAMLPGHQVAIFGAALVVGVVTSIGGRLAKVPQAVLLVPGLLILVPGSLSYESILFSVQSNTADAAGIGINSIFAAVEIVAGLLLAQLFIAPAHRH
jgi:uncharacterized membrane protein YjjP (DUF1212 family)/uncharacterized membrane protein YjjB (DUF3815 family)